MPDPRPVGPPTPSPAGWPRPLLDTLALVAETLVEGDGERRARLTAAALDLAADPAQVVQLRLVLRAFESRAANQLLTGRPARFRDHGQAARDSYQLAWATSRIPQRRTAFQGLKRLLAFFAYADPGEAGENPRLAAIGYQHRPEPVTPDPTPIRPADLRPQGAAGAADGSRGAAGAAVGPIVLEADVVVIGSGAGGGVVAAALTRAGRSVVVLEAGPLLAEPDMPVDELAAFDRLYLNHGFNVSWDASVMTMAGGGVGGGTVVNWSTSIAPPAATRHCWAHEHGVEGFDGPETDADVAALEAELGVAQSGPMPPKDELLLRGAAALGWEAAPIRRNGVDCGDCGRCGFGCRRGAKQSTLRVHLAEAWRQGARIVPDAPVDRVLVEGGRAAGAEATVTVDGIPRRLVVRAPVIVVAAGTLRTPIVLQRSGPAHPAVGRYLRLHPVSVLGALLDEDVTMWRGTMQGARSLHHLAGSSGADGHETGSYILESAPGTPGLIGLVFPWEGRDAFARLMGRIRRVAPVLGIVQDRGEGRVGLSRAGRPRIDYTVHPDDRTALRQALVGSARVAWAGGSREMLAVGTPPAWFRAPTGTDATAAFRAYLERLERFDYSPNRGSVVSAHQMGTARAGADPGGHACDPWGRVRAPDARRGADRTIPGLYVGDASLFPTALGVNPMITTMTWARRVSRTILADTPARA